MIPINRMTIAEARAMFPGGKRRNCKGARKPYKPARARKLEDAAFECCVNEWIFTFPIETQTECNANSFWHISHKRAYDQRFMVAMYLTMVRRVKLPGKVSAMHFVRLSPGDLDPGDNLNSSCKHIRDQLCAWLAGDNTPTGRGDDGPNCGITFTYDQQRTKGFGVRVHLRIEAP